MAGGEITNTDLLAAIQKSGENLQSQIKEFREVIENNKTASDIEIDKIKNKIQAYDNQILNYEKENRKRNIIIHGIKENETNRKELEDIILFLFNKGMKTSVTISEIDALFRLEIKKDSYSRPIIVKFLSQRKVWDILQNRKLLKGQNIYLNEDLPKPIIEKRKELYPLMKELRKKGELTFMKYDKLISNGKVIDPTEVDLENSTTMGKKRHCPRKTNQKLKINSRSKVQAQR